jgi:hypothetical protein
MRGTLPAPPLSRRAPPDAIPANAQDPTSDDARDRFEIPKEMQAGEMGQVVGKAAMEAAKPNAGAAGTNKVQPLDGLAEIRILSH